MLRRSLYTVGVMVAGLAIAQVPAKAESGGCLKYGAAGAVGGHLAGHGVIGALAGCGAGMWTRHEARKHAKDERDATSELNKQNRASEYRENNNPTPFYRQ